MPNQDPVQDRISGKAGFILFSDEDAQEEAEVPITDWVGTTTITFHDTTNSTTYSPNSEILFTSSVPVAHSLAVVAKGRYRIESTPGSVVARLFRGSDVFRVRLGFNELHDYADMYAWIEEFVVESIVEGVVSFTCTIRSEAEITDLSA